MSSVEHACAPRIMEIAQHSLPRPRDADVPLRHYYSARTVSEGMVRSACGPGGLGRAAGGGQRLAADARATLLTQQRRLLRNLAFVATVEAFERFLKELCAVCIDHVAPHVLDDRFDGGFPVSATSLATHFAAETLGAAMCESATWMNCNEVNDRFRRVLKSPHEDAGTFWVLPRPSQAPKGLRWISDPLDVVWQLRHTIVHNVGIVTASDAHKLTLLTKRDVGAPRLLAVDSGDLYATRRFLDDAAGAISDAVAERIGRVLTELHERTPALFEPQTVAQELASKLDRPITIGDATAAPRRLA